MNFWEYEPGALTNHPSRATIEVFAVDACRLQLEYYRASGDAIHLKRAYQVARAFGELSPPFSTMLLPHLDTWMSLGKSTLRANQRQKRNAILLDYYREMQRAKPADRRRKGFQRNLYRRVAERYKTTWQSVEQHVLEHEGRDRTRLR